MDSFEFNKIAGAVLATALGVMALSIISEVIFAPAEAEQPGMIVAGVEPGDDGHGGGGAAEPEVAPIADRLLVADIAAGEKSVGKCKSCHVFAEGDLRQMPGPNLYGVVGGPVAHLAGYDYSDAFDAEHADGDTWTFEALDEFLENPKIDIPGTKMTFAGLKRADERANVIAYLNSNSSNPLPLPSPTAAAPAEAAPADGHAPAAPADAHAPAPAAEPSQPPAAAEPAPAAPSPEPPATQVPPGEPGTEPVTPPATAPATP